MSTPPSHEVSAAPALPVAAGAAPPTDTLLQVRGLVKHFVGCQLRQRFCNVDDTFVDALDRLLDHDIRRKWTRCQFRYSFEFRFEAREFGFAQRSENRSILRFSKGVDVAKNGSEIDHDVRVEFDGEVMPVFGERVEVSGTAGEERNSCTGMTGFVELS